MITKLRLKNWRTHLDSSLDFSDGTNCFIGNMGTGKTSILDAICFGLFGTFPQLQQRKIKLEDIIMKKPERKDEAEVSLSFQLNGTEWNVLRKIGKKTTAELRKGGELIESPQPSKVTAEIESLLKIDYDLFTRAIYSEQNQLDMFLTIPKGQRMKRIDQLLAIDRFEKARGTAKTVANRSKTIMDDKKKILESLERDEAVLKFDTLVREFEIIKKEYEKLKISIKEIKGKKIREEEDIVRLKEKQKKIQSIAEQIKTYRALLEASDKDIEKMKDELVESAEKTIVELKADLIRFDLEIESSESNMKKEREELDVMKRVFTQKETTMDILEKEKIPEIKNHMKDRDKLLKILKKWNLKKLELSLEKSKKNLENYKEKIQVSTIKIGNIQDSLKEMEKVESSCPICDNKLTPGKKKTILSKKKEELKKLKNMVIKLNPSISKLEKEIKKIEKDVEEVKITNQRYTDMKDKSKELEKCDKDLKQLKLELSSYLKEKGMLEKTLVVVEKSLNKLKEDRNKINHAIMIREEIDRKIRMVKDYTKKVSELHNEKVKLSDFSPQLLEEIERGYQTLIGMEKETEAKINNNEILIRERDMRIGEIKNKIQMLEQYKRDIKKIETLVGKLKILDSALLSTQGQLRKNFVTAVNQAMQSIWSDLYPYKDFYGVRLGIEENDYVLQLQDITGWVPADGVASGGERSIACLALRIAFALVLAPQLRWLVLDEPTHNLDAKAVEDLANVLRDRVSEFVEQIFLITHDPSLETAVSGYLYRLERDKEKDGYSKAILMSKPEL